MVVSQGGGLSRSFEPEYSLELLSLQLQEYEPYLLSQELYWPLSYRAPAGSPPFLRLTTGNLMLNINEITVHLDLLDSIQEQQYFKLMLAWDGFRLKWKSTMQEKASRELNSRINLWAAYLNDLREGKDRGQNYAYEVRFRVICALLADLLADQNEIASVLERLRQLDSQLRSMFQSGPFLWTARLREMYPADLYWYLYGKPLLEE